MAQSSTCIFGGWVRNGQIRSLAVAVMRPSVGSEIETVGGRELREARRESQLENGGEVNSSMGASVKAGNSLVPELLNKLKCPP